MTFEILMKMPVVWAAIGGLVGGVATIVVVWLIIRKYGPAAKLAQDREQAASDRLMDLQQKQLDTLEATTKMQLEAQAAALKMQKEHYEGELNETRRKYESDLIESKDRAANYEKHLHDKRNEWNAEKLEMTKVIEQLQARPDLGTLMEFEQKANERHERFFVEIGAAFKSQGDVMQKMATTLDNVATALTAHDERIDERLEKVVNPVIEGMEKVVDAIELLRPKPRKKRKKAA